MTPEADLHSEEMQRTRQGPTFNDKYATCKGMVISYNFSGLLVLWESSALDCCYLFDIFAVKFQCCLFSDDSSMAFIVHSVSSPGCCQRNNSQFATRRFKIGFIGFIPCLLFRKLSTTI